MLCVTVATVTLWTGLHMLARTLLVVFFHNFNMTSEFTDTKWCSRLQQCTNTNTPFTWTVFLGWLRVEPRFNPELLRLHARNYLDSVPGWHHIWMWSRPGSGGTKLWILIRKQLKIPKILQDNTIELVQACIKVQATYKPPPPAACTYVM